MLSYNQQKCYIFVNIDEYNLFDILLLLFTFLIFNLVFNRFFVIFHVFFGKYTLTYVTHFLHWFWKTKIWLKIQSLRSLSGSKIVLNLTSNSYLYQKSESSEARVSEGKKKVVLFPEIGQANNFLSLTHPHSRMCIRIHIFNFEKQQASKRKARIQKNQKKLKKKR